MKEKKDFEWYHDNIDNDDYCIYPNDGDMCIYAIGTASSNLEYLLIYRDLPEPDGRSLRCRISLFAPEYIGITGSEYDLILSDQDKIKLMNILKNTWDKVIWFLKEEYTYPGYEEYSKDLSKIPQTPPNYLLL